MKEENMFMLWGKPELRKPEKQEYIQRRGDTVRHRCILT
jgi:hypothetical protein